MPLSLKQLLTATSCVAAVACSRSSAVGTERALPSPRSLGTIMLLGLDLPEAGTVIGGHYEGRLYEERRLSYRLTETARAIWARAARERGEALLRGAGFLIQPMGPATSDALRLWGVQFGLAGRVTAMDVRTSGQAEPLRVESRVEVSWEVLDLGRGATIFGRSIAEVARLSGTVDTAVARALDGTLARFVADSGFLRTLASPPLAAELAPPHWRELPGPDQVIALDTADLNPSGDSATVARVAAGLVLLRGADRGYGTAIVLTRDGLALATAGAARHVARMRARFASGVERPVRLVRRHGGLGVALLQVACPEACVTVDWEAPRDVAVYTQVLAVAARVGGEGSYVVIVGRVGGQWGIASGITLQTPEDQTALPGEPVARASNGKVFALVSPQPGRQSALLLSEVLRALRVQPPAR